jgi:NAD(P)-dependent dehydrogenase (short-subunit alcohol dehydrogenase family)
MLEQDSPGAIINTGSKQGITNPPGVPAYGTAKAAVKTMTEQLAHGLREEKA